MTRKRKQQDSLEQKVARLPAASDENILRRQAIIRSIRQALAAAGPEEAAVAMIAISVGASGAISSIGANIEPEHIPMLLSELARISCKLRRHSAEAGDPSSALIIPFPTSA